MIWQFISVSAMGYLMGSLPTAWLIVRSVSGEGADVRFLGNGNVGATNVGRLLGVRWGILVGGVDMVRGYAVISASTLVGKTISPDGIDRPLSDLVMLGGIAAMAGHIWPVWLRFRGGRGAAVAVGITGFLIPGPMLIMALPTALVLTLTRNISLAFGVIFLWALVIAKAFFEASWELVLYSLTIFMLVVLTDPRFPKKRCPGRSVSVAKLIFL